MKRSWDTSVSTEAHPVVHSGPSTVLAKLEVELDEDAVDVSQARFRMVGGKLVRDRFGWSLGKISE